MLRLIGSIIVFLLLLILIPMFLMGSGATSLLMLVLMAGILIQGIRLALRIFKGAAKAPAFAHREPAAGERQAEEEPEGPVSEEDREYGRIYAGKAPLPTDARSRSDYIQWLMEKGYYEEADRIASM